jgi:hypothetical protein
MAKPRKSPRKSAKAKPVSDKFEFQITPAALKKGVRIKFDFKNKAANLTLYGWS